MKTDVHRDPAVMGPLALYEYDLIAVVDHEGQVNTGHYTNFARFEDEVSIQLGTNRMAAQFPSARKVVSL